jgi:hybrid cluster-associated redox disulfide protein
LRWRKDRTHWARDHRAVRIGQISGQPVSDVIAARPEAAAVFVRYGMGCVGCAFARFETVREAAVAHGLDPNVLAKSLARAIQPMKRNMK